MGLLGCRCLFTVLCLKIYIRCNFGRSDYGCYFILLVVLGVESIFLLWFVDLLQFVCQIVIKTLLQRKKFIKNNLVATKHNFSFFF